MSQDAGKDLKYRLKAGQTYVYALKIVADRSDATETFDGHIELAVKSAEGNTITFTPTLILPSQLKFKAAAGPFGPPGPPRPFGPHGPPFFTGPRQITIDDHGKVLKTSAETPLSYLLGQATEYVLERLSGKGEMRWERTLDLVIREIESLVPFARFGPRNETNTPAKEAITYELAETKQNVARITKKYELKTAVAGDDTPRIQLVGSGEILFDVQAGVLKSGEHKLTLILSEKNVTVKVPITLSCRLLDAAAFAAVKKDREERMAKALQAAKLAQELKPISDAEVTQALADLKSGDRATFRAGADRLARSIPLAQRRDEVAAALEPLLEGSDVFMRQEVAKALKVWGTAKNVPALIQLLNDSNVFVRHAAVDALGGLADAKGADAVAQQLPELGSRMQASKSLKAMGPVAEKAVIPFLKDRDLFVRVEACKILAEIGTKDSVAALKDAQRDANRLVAMEAGKAITTIEGRKAQK